MSSEHNKYYQIMTDLFVNSSGVAGDIDASVATPPADKRVIVQNWIILIIH